VPLVICSLSRLHVPDLPKVVLALGLGGWAIARGGGPDGVLAAVAAGAAVLSALVLMWALGVLANYKVLTHVEFDGWAVLFATQNLARVPVPLYGPVLRVVLTAVVPVAFLATVPVQLFAGEVAPWVAAISVLLAAGSIAATSRLWRRELLRYTGAMG
jgi:ABC-2 type transport system permease protein